MKNTKLKKANLIKTVAVLIILQTFDLINLQSSYSQVNEDWVKYYYGATHTVDMSSAMVMDKDGNLIVVGELGGSDNGFLTMKYDPSGDTIWLRTYHTQTTLESDRANAVTTDDSGNVFVTGYTYNSTTRDDYTTIKYNSSGNQQWVKHYDGPGHFDDEAKSIVVDDLGNCYVTGTDYGAGTNYDYATIKYSPSGDEVWVRRYNNPHPYTQTDKAISIALDINGNVIVTGYVATAATSYDILTIKYNPDGDEIWTKKYSTLYEDQPNALTLDKNGNILIAGWSKYSSSSSNKDWITIKLDPAGNELWKKSYKNPNGSTSDDMASSIVLDDENNIYVAGRDYAGSVTTDFVTIKYNSDGDSLWVRRYDEAGLNDRAPTIVLDANENVYLTGVSGTKINTLKYTNSGEFIWNKFFNDGNSGFSKVSIVIESTGSIYLSGSTGGATGYPDIVTMKYSQKLSVNLSVLIEGLYDSSTDSMKADTVSVALKNYYSPFNIVDSATGLLDTKGRGRFYFDNAAMQVPYYVTVKHRNSIETWTSNAINFTSNEMAYDFTSSASQAFGDNQVLEGTKYCMYSGDIDQDGFINTKDVLLIYNEMLLYTTGFNTNDLNGDEIVDITDVNIAHNNGALFVSTISPESDNSQLRVSKSDKSKENDEKINDKPGKFIFHNNFPNPFNPSTTIKFELPQQSFVKLRVYDLSGREVATLVNGIKQAGIHSVNFDGSDLSSGVYFYGIVTDNFSKIKKMTLIK